MDREQKIDALRGLVNTFRENIGEYKQTGYKEAKVRRDFIDTFFELLDWDIANKSGKSENFRDVIIEDTVEISGAQKAPDYCFKIGKERQFFVEAKKPTVKVKDEIDPAHQVRRYGNTANLPLSILTDFEEFAVYDTRIKLQKNDKAGVGRIFYCTYDEYEKNFDFIYNTFSKTAIEKGSFEKYLQGAKGKRGSENIDKGLLSLVESFRLELAKNIAKQNKKLDPYQLNAIVTKIIDRIIFLRIAEGRDVEKYGTLLKAAEKEKGIYKNIHEIFVAANEKFNSELFKPDDTIDNVAIDDIVLKDIVSALYYPVCQYEFSVLPLEILGNIYEQFLGKTIRLTESHIAKVEEKPEVRKAGGVYYTPQYIVSYIVENTVGEKLNDLDPKGAAILRVLDPACGSGSFLIGAYDYLLEWHYKYYTGEKNIGKAEKEKRIYKFSKGYRLTIEEKKRILLNNIYGVDIDPQAVEVTKLSLLLKILENENAESAGTLFSYSMEKILPDLSNNIKCGNSLIGTDFYKDKQMNMFDAVDMRKVNAFDWEKKFPEVFEAGGFDVVIGNPPYGAEYGTEIKYYLTEKYDLAITIADTFLMFFIKAYSISNQNALISYIIPSTWLYMPQYYQFRKQIASHKEINEIQLFRKPVFEKVTVETCTVISKNRKPVINSIYHFKEIKGEPANFIYVENSIPQNILLNEQEVNFILSNQTDKNLFNKIQSDKVTLKDISLIVCGLTPYRLGKGKPAQREKIIKERGFDSDYKKDNTYRQYLMGRDFNRYAWQIEKKRYISYGDWLAEPRYKAPFDDDKKIIIRQTSDKLIAHFDTNKYLSLKNVHNLRVTDEGLSYECLLALLNSKLLDWWYQKLIPEKGRVFAEVKVVNLEKLPIYKINFTNSKDKDIHDMLVLLVDQMLAAQKEYHTAKESDKPILKQKIDAIDAQIDALVYELYGLTEEEINLIESNSKTGSL